MTGASIPPKASELRFTASKSSGDVSALFLRPDAATHLYVFAHGAGADLRHAFMENAAQALARNGIATLRYNFPYMERRGRLDPKPILHATVRSAVSEAARVAPDLPLIAGGKSMGGRMTSEAAAGSPLDGVAGLAFAGFPLHPAGRPGTERAAHLENVTVPMLFLQGTRDALADLELLTPICARLGNRAILSIIDGADHAFHVLKRSGRTDPEVLDELAAAIAAFAREVA